MRNKGFFAVLSCLLAVCLFGTSPALALEEQPLPEQVLQEILDYRLAEAGASDLQGYIEGALSAKAGTGGESIILALAQSGVQYDFTSYNAALLNYLSNNSVPSASTRQKYAFTLMAAGCDSSYIAEVLSDSIGQMGIVSTVYGLHLLTNGGAAPGITAEGLIAELLAARLTDGGWALYGNSSDVDVTAMVIQCLAPYYDNSPDVTAAVDGAVALLSSRQSAQGGFASYGEENTESAAQVIIALSALGIDCRTDPRFIKEQGSVYDALLSGQLPDGSFAHVPGGDFSTLATDQAMCALTAMVRTEQGRGSLFVIDEQLICTPADVVYTPYAPEPEITEPTDSNSGAGLKWWICAGMIAAAAVLCGVLWLTGKRHRNNYIVTAAATVLLCGVVLFSNISTADSYYGTLPEKTDTIGTVTLSIRCDAVADRGEEHIPADGVILPETELELCEGETVYDLLIQCARAYTISVESDGTSYIQGIGHIYEQDFGSLSGWVYLVNGESHSIGCDSYEPTPGDRIEWVYTLDLGREFVDGE